MTKPNRREGAEWLRHAYAYWRQLLVFFDLAGEDGRPSITKLCAVAVLVCMLYIAVETLNVSGGIVTLIICVFAVLFGRTMFRRFLDRWSGTANVAQLDTTEHTKRDEKAVHERRESMEWEHTP